MVNSTEVVVHSKTNLVKVVQNQLLLCANWHCKIVMTYPEIETTLSGTNTHIQYSMNIWLSKIFVRVGFHTICQSLKKKLVSIGGKKCSTNTIGVLRNVSMTSWQVMNRGFKGMSPKVNSSRLYGCFKKSQIQQKLLTHDALPSKWSPVFFQKIWTCRNRTTRTT